MCADNRCVTGRGAVYFDRDGVLNEDRGYVGDLNSFVWLPGAKDAILRVNRFGLYVFVVTNQSGVARGFYEESAVCKIHDFMQADLNRIGAHIDGFRYCPHHEHAALAEYRINCSCRKPKPGMIIDLANFWNVDLNRSIIIGDQPRDVAAGIAAGIEGHLLQPDESLDAIIGRFLEKVNR